MSLIVQNPISLSGFGNHPVVQVGAILLAIALAIAAVAKLALSSLGATLLSGQESNASVSDGHVVEQLDERKELGGPDESRLVTGRSEARGNPATAIATRFDELD